MKQPVDQPAIELPLMGAVGIAEQRQRPRLSDDRLPTRGDLLERLVPGNRRELALAFGADAAQGGCQAPGRIEELVVVVDLGAGIAGGQWIGGIAPDARDATILNIGEHGAHVGTIMGADDTNGLQTGSPCERGQVLGRTCRQGGPKRGIAKGAVWPQPRPLWVAL
jgi:hypothetical protein